jgi:hypothetical protein
MKIRQHDVAKPVYCRARIALLPQFARARALCSSFMVNAALWRFAPKHDPEKSCPGLDPGWMPVFGKDHARTTR